MYHVLLMMFLSSARIFRRAYIFRDPRPNAIMILLYPKSPLKCQHPMSNAAVFRTQDSSTVYGILEDLKRYTTPRLGLDYESTRAGYVLVLAAVTASPLCLTSADEVRALGNVNRILVRLESLITLTCFLVSMLKSHKRPAFAWKSPPPTK
jgi:hypothetical protein